MTYTGQALKRFEDPRLVTDKGNITHDARKGKKKLAVDLEGVGFCDLGPIALESH